MNTVHDSSWNISTVFHQITVTYCYTDFCEQSGWILHKFKYLKIHSKNISKFIVNNDLIYCNQIHLQHILSIITNISDFANLHTVQPGKQNWQKNTIGLHCWISQGGEILNGIDIALAYNV